MMPTCGNGLGLDCAGSGPDVESGRKRLENVYLGFVMTCWEDYAFQEKSKCHKIKSCN